MSGKDGVPDGEEEEHERGRAADGADGEEEDDPNVFSLKRAIAFTRAMAAGEDDEGDEHAQHRKGRHKHKHKHQHKHLQGRHLPKGIF